LPRLLVMPALAAAVLLAACGGDDGNDDTVEARDPLRNGPQGNVAQFVVECELSHFAYDDPIVLPDLPGESHLHQFFGNVDVTSDPDYERAIDGETSCERSRDTASYWAPALLDGTGEVIEPRKLTAYYRPGPGIDPTTVEPYPAGLMMVAGDSGSDVKQPVEIIAWGCGSNFIRETSPPDCRNESARQSVGGDAEQSTRSLRLWITFPDCWDGERLTSFGSGTHVRSSDGGECPESHPVAIAQLQMAIDFPAADPAGLSLASGGTETAHADFWNVWDQEALEDEVRYCINRDLVCGVAE
jgi:hypothetical protein